MKNYSGIVVIDGYHSLEKEREDLKIAGCWSHVQHQFANVVKTLRKEKVRLIFDYDALKQIATIYKIGDLLGELL